MSRRVRLAKQQGHTLDNEHQGSNKFAFFLLFPKNQKKKTKKQKNKA
jgi:hypothetical protein